MVVLSLTMTRLNKEPSDLFCFTFILLPRVLANTNSRNWINGRFIRLSMACFEIRLRLIKPGVAANVERDLLSVMMVMNNVSMKFNG